MTKITRFRWNKFQDEEVYMTYNDVRDIIEDVRKQTENLYQRG